MTPPPAVARACLASLRAPGGRVGARRVAPPAAFARYSAGASGARPADYPPSVPARPSSLGSPPVPSGEADRRLGRALQALQLEESRGHCDVRGARSLFSEYAASELARLGDLLPPGGGKDRWRDAVAEGFRRYRDLDPPQRANLVAEARSLLERGPAAANPRPAPPSSTAPREERAERPAASPAPTPAAAAAAATAEVRDHHRRRARGQRGGLSAVHESETWASALRHVSRRSAEVARVNEDDASRAYSPSPSGGAERADPESKSAAFPPAAAGPGSVFTADRAEEKNDIHNVSSSSASGEEQGGAYWHALRASRLTASAFANAMGFWSGGRNALWEEKLGLAPPFAGNDATEWGARTEDEAAAAYARLTGADVSRVLFRVLSPDEAELWLGASPDGLIAAPAAQSGGDGGDDAHAPDRNSLPPGVLEIKCPWNRGRPLDATPYPRVPWYYVPQVQGLMAVFDRPYCDVFCYTVNGGSAIYRVERDPEYWALMYRALSDFWWQHVVPGKHALEKAGNNTTDAAAAGEGDRADGGDAGGGRAEAAWEKYRPPETHELTEELKRRSREMAERAMQRKYSAEDTRGA